MGDHMLLSERGEGAQPPPSYSKWRPSRAVWSNFQTEQINAAIKNLNTVFKIQDEIYYNKQQQYLEETTTTIAAPQSGDEDEMT